MLLIPANHTLSWRRPPWATLLLLIINVAVFYVVQAHDEENSRAAYQYYFTSDLPSIEFPRYVAYLNTLDKKDAKETAAKLQTAAENPEQDEKKTIQLFSAMLRDDVFIQRLNRDDIVKPGDEDFDAWKTSRERFTSLLKRSTVYSRGFTPAKHEPSTFLSHMFLHGSKGHLFGNMLMMCLVGIPLEFAIGGWALLLGYLGGGLLSVTGFWQIYASSYTPLVGASGAIAGLMGLYTVIYGLRRIKVFYTLLFYFGYARIRALWLLPVWFGNELYQQYSSENSNIAYIAHMGGLLGGALLGFLLLKLAAKHLHLNEVDAPEREDKLQIELERGRKHLAKLELDQAQTIFRRLLQQHPGNLAILTHLYKASRAKPQSAEYHQIASQLLSHPDRSPAATRTLHETLLDYRALTGGATRLPPNLAVTLIRTFASQGLLPTAESLATTLLGQTASPPDLADALLVLAGAAAKHQSIQQQTRWLEEICKRFPAAEAAQAAQRILQHIRSPGARHT